MPLLFQWLLLQFNRGVVVHIVVLLQHLENGWCSVDQSYYQYVIDNKAYIYMPNQSSFIFLNPRDFFAGISISYDF